MDVSVLFLLYLVCTSYFYYHFLPSITTYFANAYKSTNSRLLRLLLSVNKKEPLVY